MKLKPLALTCAVAAFATTQAFSATTIADPSFEDAANFVDDGNGVGKWNSFSQAPASATITTAAARTGSSSAELVLGAANLFAGFFQDIMVNPGDTITLDLWHQAVNQEAGSIEIRIEWQSGGGEIARTANANPAPGSTFENFTISHLAPAGADTARVVYATQSFGGDTDAVVNIDDFTVSGSTVPEPSGALLLALGAFGFVSARSRK